MLLGLCRPFVPRHAVFSNRSIPQVILSRSSNHQVLIEAAKHRRPRIDRLPLHPHRTSRQDLLLPHINILHRLQQLMQPHPHDLGTPQRMVPMGQPRIPSVSRTRAPRRKVQVQNLRTRRRKNTSPALAPRESIGTKTSAKPRRIPHTRPHQVLIRTRIHSIQCRSQLYLGHLLHSVFINT